MPNHFDLLNFNVPLLTTTRRIYLSAIALCLTGFISVIILDGVLGLAPCPLCIFQRIALAAVMFTAVILWITNPRRKQIMTKVGAAILLFSAAIGLSIALRHLWLQNLPADLKPPSCGSTELGYLLDVLPVWEVIETILAGTADCAEIQWRLFGIGWASIPFLSVCLFLLLILNTLLLFTKPSAVKPQA